MDIQGLKDDRGYDLWHEYEPIDAQYVRYILTDPSVLAAGHKINDVYHTFCDARASLLRANYKDYGELCADNDISRLCIRTTFLKEALMDYAICLDISWQVIWAFIQPSSFEYLVRQNYKEMEKSCTSESVHMQLNCAIAQQSKQAELIKDLLAEFENEKVVKTVRNIYNSIKHRGMMYFKGFCDDSFGKFYFDSEVEMPLRRETHDPEQIQELLLLYHEKFEKYFNALIALIMPRDYKNNQVELINYMVVTNEIERIQSKKDDIK